MKELSSRAAPPGPRAALSPTPEQMPAGCASQLSLYATQVQRSRRKERWMR